MSTREHLSNPDEHAAQSVQETDLSPEAAKKEYCPASKTEVAKIAAEYGLTTEELLEELRLRSSGSEARTQKLIEKAGMDLKALHPHEWNFDAVPDSELAACWCWEYGRESPTIRRIHALFEQYPTDLNKEVESVLSIGQLGKILFMYPHSAMQFGARAFPYPWQSLPPHRRQELAEMAVSRPPAFKVENSVRVANCLASHARALESQTAQRRGTEIGWWKKPEGRPYILWSDGGETLILTVNWMHYNLQELANEFLKCAKNIRPHYLRKPNGNANAPRTLRTDLARLAAWRLLSVYPPKSLLGAIRVRVRGGRLARVEIPQETQVWCALRKSKQFSGYKWIEAEQWRAARSEARRRFKELFPFAKSDKPLSDQRR